MPETYLESQPNPPSVMKASTESDDPYPDWTDIVRTQYQSFFTQQGFSAHIFEEFLSTEGKYLCSNDQIEVIRTFCEHRHEAAAQCEEDSEEYFLKFGFIPEEAKSFAQFYHGLRDEYRPWELVFEHLYASYGFEGYESLPWIRIPAELENPNPFTIEYFEFNTMKMAKKIIAIPSKTIAEAKLFMASPNENLLYHGTSLDSAVKILRDGIDMCVGREHMDFGRGFYLQTDVESAMRWARRVAKNKKAVVLCYKITDEQLQGQELLLLTDKEKWKLTVQAFRRDLNCHIWSAQHPAIFGPVLANPGEVARNSAQPRELMVDQLRLNNPKFLAELSCLHVIEDD